MPIHEQEFFRYLDQSLQAIVEEIADKTVEEIRLSVSVPFPPASLPEAPPHRRSGDLQKGISWVTDGDVTRILVGVPYASYLELGTLNMEPRPFVGPALERVQSQIEALLEAATRKMPPT